MDAYELEEFNHVCNVLRGFGIKVVDSNGEMRPFNRVMIDVAKFLRDIENPDTRRITRQFIMECILGKRYVHYI